MNPILWSALRGAMKSMTALLPLLKRAHHLWNDSGHWHRPGSHVGLFHPDRKEYRETKLYGIKEIISLTGTLDMFQKKPYGHFNIALGGEVAIHRAAIWSRASSELPPKSSSPVLTRSSCGRRTNPWALICGNYPKRRNLRYNFIVKSWGNLFCSSFFLLFFIFSH